MKRVLSCLLAICLVLTSGAVLPASAMEMVTLQGTEGTAQQEITQSEIQTETQTESQADNQTEQKENEQIIDSSDKGRIDEVTTEDEISLKADEIESVYAAAAKSEVVKVACAGDSITYGDQSTNRVSYSYPSQLQKLLGSGFEVRNYGINGQTMTQSSWCNKYLNTAESQALKTWQPDVIILMLGTNDSQDICWINTDGKGKFEAAARELVQTYKGISSAPKIFIATSPTADAKNQFLIMPDVIDNEIVPMQKRLAEELGCSVIDVNEFTKDFQKDSLMTLSYNGKPDLVHPNNDGYLQLAKFMYNGISGATGLEKKDVKTIEIDSQNANVKYEGGWGDWSDGELYMGTEKYVTVPGSSATLEFEGTGIQVTGIRTYQLSYMDVYIDGKFMQTVDTYVASGVFKHEPLYAIDSLPYGNHTIKVVLNDKKESYHMYTKISLDSFRIFKESQGFVDKISFRTDADSFRMSGMNDTLQVYADVLPENAANKKLNYRIVPEGAASITENGLITAKIAEGSFYVYAFATDGSMRSQKQAIQVGFEKEETDAYTFVDDGDSSVIYTGTWTDKKDDMSHEGTLKETHVEGNKASITFTGTGISVIGQLNRLGNNSYAEITIDGVYKGIATFMHNKDDVGSVSKEVLFMIKNLAPGTHILNLTAKKNVSGAPMPGNCGVTLDGFRIYHSKAIFNLTAFNEAITNATLTLKNAVIGTESGMYPQESADSLQTQIQTAQESVKAAKSQSEVDGLARALNEEIEKFARSVVGTGVMRSLEIEKAPHGTIELYQMDGTKLTAAQVPNGSRIVVKMTSEEHYRLASLTAGSVKKSYPEGTKEISVTVTVNQNLKISAIFSYIKIKIACVGDSITYGACSTAPQKNAYSAILQKKLGSNYEVRNFAMPSACLRYDGSFAYTNQSVYQKSLDFEPDMVIIMLGTNDSIPQNWNSYGAAGFKTDTKKLVESYKNLPSSPTVYLATAPYTYDEGRKTVINQEVVPAQREVAASEGYSLIDMNKDTYELSRSFYYGDYLHFNDAGYSLMAEFILEELDVPDGYKTADKSALYNLYYRYQDITEADCTAATWSAFAVARQGAKKALDKGDVVQSELTLAQSVLQNAVNQLQFQKKIKVACVGDSITYGYGANPRETYSYPAQIQKLLGNQYEVRNFGVNSRTMNDTVGVSYMATSEYTNSKNFNPDIVIIMLGTNDSKKNNWNDTTGEKTYTAASKKMLDSYKNLASKPKILIATSPAVAKDMGSSSDSDGEIIRDSIIQGKIAPLQRKLAKEYGCKLIDINQKTEDLEDLSTYLSTDLIHPHNQGYTLLASYMYEGVIGTVPAYKTDLLKAVGDAEKIDTAKYVLNTVETYREALKYAQEVLKNENLTTEDQPLVIKAINGLKEAVDGLMEKAEMAALQESVHLAKSVDLSLYTDVSAEKVIAALSAANKLLADTELPATEQAQVDAAKAVLDEAVKALQKKADKAALQASVNAAEKIELSLYTKETAGKVTEALKNAKILLADSNLSVSNQNQLTAAAAALNTAVKNLVKIPPKAVKVTNVVLTTASVKLTLSKTQRLKVTVSPSNAQNKNLQWTSSNKKVAAVNTKGVITAKGIGSTVITAKAMDGSGKKDSVKVTVLPKAMSAPKIKKAGSSSVKVTWIKVTGGISCEIQMSSKKNTGFVKKGTVSAKAGTFTAKKLKKDRNYYFRIRAVKKIGKTNYRSEWSKPVKYKLK